MPEWPVWAFAILAVPGGEGGLQRQGDALCRADGTAVGRIEAGILRFPMLTKTDGVAHYRAIGGARFYERRDVPLSMSSLDTPVYHAHLARLGGDPEGVVIDIGGGDGRNAMALLDAGHRRVVVIDAAGEALVRFRDRIAEGHPDWLDRLLLIEADARALPLATGVAERVVAIEVFYYLNEDYVDGLREAKRVMAAAGRMLVSERDYEAGLIMRALYFGLDPMLRSARTGDLWEGEPDWPVRTRSFTEEQLCAVLAEAGLAVSSMEGTSLLALVIGWLRGQGRTEGTGDETLAAVGDLLERLARHGGLRRCHVAVVEHRPSNDARIARRRRHDKR